MLRDVSGIDSTCGMEDSSKVPEMVPWPKKTIWVSTISECWEDQ